MTTLPLYMPMLLGPASSCLKPVAWYNFTNTPMIASMCGIKELKEFRFD